MDLLNPSEQHFIILLKQRDNLAFNQLYSKYGDILYGIILTFVSDKKEAVSILEDAMIAIYRGIDDYDPAKSSLFIWLQHITNQTISAVMQSAPFIYKIVSAHGMRKIVQQLDEENAALLELILYQGYTIDMLAKHISLPVDICKQKLHTALRQLAERMPFIQ